MDNINEKNEMLDNQPELKSDAAGEEPTGMYINPRTDFAFKYLSGDKKTMLKFLNDVLKTEALDIEGDIVDLTYNNT
jgi:hypothetical protein